MKDSASLRHIPAALFEEFTAGTEPRQTAAFWDEDGEYRVAVAPCREPGRVRPLTLVLEEFRSRAGIHVGSLLSLFEYPMKAESFDPKYDGYTMKPLFEVSLDTDNPARNPAARWEDGKGFWTEEFIVTSFRDGVVIPDDGEPSSKVMIGLRERSRELAALIASPGHWQFEWDPRGDYSRKPEPAVR